MQRPKTGNLLNLRKTQRENAHLTIETPEETKKYIGSKELSFKKRYYGTGDLSSPATEDSKSRTTLSAYYWQQKEKGHKPQIRWKI